MEIQVWIELIVRVLVGLVVVIPLVVELVEKTKVAVEEKNWNKIVSAVLDLMVVAEEEFTDGSTRKEWVLESISEVATILNYNYDEIAEAKISDMIDAICEASKKIN